MPKKRRYDPSSLIQFIRERIKERIESDLDGKQNKLAQALGESEGWLSNQLNQNKSFDVEDLYRIAQALNIPTGELLPDNGNPGISIEEHMRLIMREEIERLKNK